MTPLDESRPVAAQPSDFEKTWAGFLSTAAAHADTARNAVKDARRSATRILDRQASAEPRPNEDDPLAHRTDAGRVFLTEPLREWERQRPLERAFEALEAYHRSMGDLVRRIPVAVTATGAEVLGAVDGGEGLAAWLLGHRKKAGPVGFAGPIASAVETAERYQRAAEGRCLMAFGKGVQRLRQVWEQARARIDGGEPEPEDGQPLMTSEAVAQSITAALAEWDRAVADLPARAAGALVEAGGLRRRAQPARMADRGRAAFAEHWSRQLGALAGELVYCHSLEAAEVRLLDAGRTACARLEAERADLLKVIDEFLGWLDHRLEHQSAAEPFTFDTRTPEVVPAAARLAELASGVRNIVGDLPNELHLLRVLDPGPGRRRTLKSVEPRRILVRAIERVTLPPIESAFEAVQENHIGLIGEIERARQVVEFGSAREAGEPDTVQEALENARALLRVDGEARTSQLPTERWVVRRGLVAGFDEYRLVFRQNRVGVVAHLGKLGLRQGAKAAAAAALVAPPAAARAVGRAVVAATHRFLVAIEWAPTQSPHAIEVIRRSYLPTEFTLDTDTSALPAIYRRLFRLDAVSDSRFLIGRDEEMSALAEARAFWEQGRPVAVLVVGERGSGKTSLINCAVDRPLAGLEIIRGEVNQRRGDPRGVREFLAETIGGAPEDLETTLAERRRVIVVEECERMFVRRVGGFEGVREFQRIIAASFATTLWVAVTNRSAFRLLDAALQLGNGFSHRLNVATARPAALRQAILVRHNLSGLRLRFIPAPASGGRLGRLLASVRRKVDPADQFFSALSRESDGIFRTAFKLWLAQIDSVQAGVVIMKPVGRPPLDEVIDQLDQSDAFSLAAIMQHGSVTPEEHAAVFETTLGASRAQLDDLLARELIEPDPGRPGFRIRPSALRVVRESLRRRNLE